MSLSSFFARRRHRDATARELYVSAVAQSRRPGLYLRFAVPDTVDGRFDLLAAHAFLLMRRLGQVGGGRAGEAKALSQALFDLMFADMDSNLREIGVSDMSIGKKVKQMAKAFYGRVSAYDTGLQTEGGELAEAVARNLYRASPPSAEAPQAFAGYLRRQAAHLDGLADQALLDGRVEWLAEEDGDAA